MKVKLAKTAGFCFGVKRAVETVYEEIGKEQNAAIYTYGPIIHNEEVVKDLKQKGVQVLQEEKDLDALMEGTVIIRSHGVEKRIYEKMQEKQLKIVDATCPFVKKIHDIVSKESREGRHIVIIGNDEHPEVQGIKGWVEGPVTVIQTEADAEAFFPYENRTVCIVSQTTFNYNKFKELVEILQKKSYDIIVSNNFCVLELRLSPITIIASTLSAIDLASV